MPVAWDNQLGSLQVVSSRPPFPSRRWMQVEGLSETCSGRGALFLSVAPDGKGRSARAAVHAVVCGQEARCDPPENRKGGRPGVAGCMSPYIRRGITTNDGVGRHRRQ